MSKKSIVLIVSIVLAVAIGLGGTLAFFTDRDSDTNVFTVGNVDIELNEDFVQNSTLMPGVEINKDTWITNQGTNPAYVWMTVAVPEGLHDCVDLTWTDDASPEGPVDAKDADGNPYKVYLVKVEEPLEPGEETPVMLDSVKLKPTVDYRDGQFVLVENGEVTPIDYDLADAHIPVSAFAIQTEGFENFDEAYAAYGDQWGDFVVEKSNIVNASTSDELAKAVEDAAGEDVMILLEAGEYETNFKVEGGTNLTIVGAGEDTVLSGQIASTSSTAGTLTLQNLTYKVDDSIQDSTGISQTGKSAIALWSNQKVVCQNVTFEMSLKDSTAITTWWDVKEGTSVTVKDCTFNCNGQRPIRATGHVTVENTTFNDPYRYALQLTAKTSTADQMDKAIINFNNNTIVNGENGKAFVYGIQLEGADYGCHDCVINGTGNTIEEGGADSAMYYCECGKVEHETIEWNTEVPAVHET